jgi:hypothetical protein
MPFRITAAKFIRDIAKGSLADESLSIEDLTKEKYHEKYRDHLYCPTEGCTAPILFAEGPKLKKYFKNVNQHPGESENHHTAECLYYVEYDFSGKPHAKNAVIEMHDVTIEHIRGVLKRLYNKEHPSPTDTKKDKKNKKKPPSKRVKKTNSDNTQSIASAIDNNNRSSSGKRRNSPRIPYKSIDEISISDYSTKAIPKLEGIWGYLAGNIVRKNNIAYVDLFRKDNKKARIFFSEEFITNSHAYALQTYQTYINKSKSQIFFACVGTVKQTGEYAFNIYPDSEDCIALDNYSLGTIVNRLNAQKV